MSRMSYASANDLFSSQETREARENIQMAGDTRDIDILLLEPYPNHPFQVKHDAAMDDLIASIQENGLLTPLIVREQDDKFQIIAGHRRKMACEKLGITTVKCQIREYDDDEAAVVMVESNIQRTNLRPSELARALKIRHDAELHQGKREADITTSHDETIKKRGRRTLSRAMEHRYIRLNYLTPELLTMVDNGRIGILAGMQLSYVTPSVQNIIAEAAADEKMKIDVKKAKALRDMSDEQEDISMETIMEALKPTKKEQKEKKDSVEIAKEPWEEYIPASVKPEQKMSYVIEAIKFYKKHCQPPHA